MKITEHFDSNEFKCNCGKNEINNELIKRLEQLFGIIGADKIIISSGYRCPNCSVKVGGSKDDCHTKGGAADLIVYKGGKPMNSFAVAAIAEQSGLFNGIGIINDNYLHLDIRGIIPYKNSKWFGNEKTGEKYSSFAAYLPKDFNIKQTNKVKKIRVFLDDELLFEKQI